MRLFWAILSLSLTVGCVSTPDKIILFSEDPLEVTRIDNLIETGWKELKEHVSLTKEKGFKFKNETGRVEVEVGRVKSLSSKDARVLDKAKPDYARKHWGVKIIFWFKELVVI